MRTSIYFTAVACLVSTGVPAGQRTLWDSVREHHVSAGPLEISVSTMVPVRDLAGLVSEADLVVAGRIVGAEVGLNKEESAIVTVDELKPQRLLFGRDELLPSDGHEAPSLFIERLGGTLEMLGMRDRRVKPFALNDDVVLFLKHVESSDRYYVPFEPYGSFQIRGGRLATMDKGAAEVHHDLEGVKIETLAERIVALLRPPQN